LNTGQPSGRSIEREKKKNYQQQQQTIDALDAPHDDPVHDILATLESIKALPRKEKILKLYATFSVQVFSRKPNLTEKVVRQNFRAK